MADYYQLLGVTPQASEAEIRQAHAKLAREQHPDHFPDPDAKQKAQRGLQDITAAFNTLANPKSREEYDAHLLRPGPCTAEEVATDAFWQSKAAQEAGHLDDEITLLRTAAHHAHHAPDQMTYLLALGRALGKAAGPKAAREAILVLEKVIQLAPQNAAAYIELAAVLERQGLKLRAQKAKK